MTKKNLFVLLIAYCLLLIAFPLAASGALVPCIDRPCSLCDFFLLISNIYQFIGFKLAPPLAVCMFLLSGALFLVSGGSEERVTQAKKIFINTFFGLVLIYTSWLIVNGIINIIGASVEGFNKENWFIFTCTDSSSFFPPHHIFAFPLLLKDLF